MKLGSAMVALWSVLGGCMPNDNAANLLYAVEQRDPAAVQVALAARRGLEQRDESGTTPLLKALASAQFVIAEMIVDGGGDIWAVDEFGLTAGHFLQANPWPPGSIEGDAKQRVIGKLKARGFPYPPPPQEEVQRLVAEGRWPPRAG